ncbi:MAG: SprA-related family protein [Desulfamplus sp.]|nr:SprA-related family protein [Desulfamplus sp.]MBF0242412.1 SprA-related family protein [Desulfamplus sp.]MBF0390637.1 SprA-related family protein [Desulfamplus sp.]
MAISIKPYQSSSYWFANDSSKDNFRVVRSPQSKGEAQEGQSAADTQNSNQNSKNIAGLYNQKLSEDQLRLLTELQNSDREVRAHEMAHVAAGGQYITSGAQLEYRKGPDGKRYAVAGEVSIDTSPVAGDPSATVEKMRQVQRAALAPASPSSQDRKVASSAGALAAKAMSELIVSQAEDRIDKNSDVAFGAVENRDKKSVTESNSQQNQDQSPEMIRQKKEPFDRSTRMAADSYARISMMPENPQMSRFQIAV